VQNSTEIAYVDYSTTVHRNEGSPSCIFWFGTAAPRPLPLSPMPSDLSLSSLLAHRHMAASALPTAALRTPRRVGSPPSRVGTSSLLDVPQLPQRKARRISTSRRYPPAVGHRGYNGAEPPLSMSAATGPESFAPSFGRRAADHRARGRIFPASSRRPEDLLDATDHASSRRDRGA